MYDIHCARLSYKPAEALQQNQTLSLRISKALGKRLEDIRKLRAVRKGESVSTSEIAKQLLESVREDRYEVVELLANPAESLLEIRRKGQAGQLLSRAQVDGARLLRAAGRGGVRQESTFAGILHRHTQGVRCRA